ncbi:MAG: hypothetical protein KDA85_00080 [Planctomycetaceae bacterium]|nr:hypothetical protein [Planctomycetaceae bacterium]
MSRMIVASCAALALGLVTMKPAAADHCRYRSSYSGFSYSSPGFSISYGSYPSYGYSSYAPYGGYSHGSSHRVWHDTSHYDYHPTEVVRHRGHYDVIPGHYDLHRTGHWDRHYHR